MKIPSTITVVFILTTQLSCCCWTESILPLIQEDEHQDDVQHNNLPFTINTNYSINSSHTQSEIFFLPIEEILLVTKGINAGLELAEGISISDFIKTAQHVAKLSVPLMSSVSFLASFISSSVQDESSDVKWIKSQFLEINRKMDSMEKQIEDIKRQIDWSTIKISFGAYERTIQSIYREFTILLDAPEKVFPMLQANYLLLFNRQYKDATRKLYDGLINSNNIYNDNLIVAIRKFSRNHQTKVQQFLLRTVGLVVKGMQLEIGYLAMTNSSKSLVNYWINDWEMRLNALSKEFLKVNEEIERGWYQQAESDIDEFLRLNTAMGHHDFNINIVNMLVDKFPRQHWFVTVHKAVDTTEPDDHFYATVCNGFTRYNQHNRSLVVATVPVNKTNTFSLIEAEDTLNKIDTYLGYVSKGVAKVLHDMIIAKAPVDCQKYSAALVVPNGEMYARGPTRRKVSVNWKGTIFRYLVPWTEQFYILLMG